MGTRYTKNHNKCFLSLLPSGKNYITVAKGFTLIELLVTVIIVGVLVAAAVPIFRQNVKRVMATEGNALAGSIKTAERIYFAEKNSYTANWADLSGDIDIDNNKYFHTAPTITAAGKGDNAFFIATVNGSGEASGISVTIDSEGSITATGF